MLNKRSKIVLQFILFSVCAFFFLLKFIIGPDAEVSTQSNILLVDTNNIWRNNLTCPEGNILTVGAGGQLGNKIWEYMSLYSIYQLYRNECHLQGFVPKRVKEDIEMVFERISLPTIEDIPDSCLENRQILTIGGHDEIPKEQLRGNNAIVQLATFSARYEYVVPFGFKNIKKELRFQEQYLQEVQKCLKAIKEQYYNEYEDVVFVGMHYRGTDYIPMIRRYLQNKFKGPPTYKFYNRAMSYFQEKFERIVFILITIDDGWLRSNKNNFKKDAHLIINPCQRDKVLDLILLANCNHSIISYGSYSSTAAFLAGGITFVYDLNITLETKGPVLALGLASKLSNWYTIT